MVHEEEMELPAPPQAGSAEAGQGSGTLHTARAALGLQTSIGVPSERVGGERDGIEWLLDQDGNVAVV